MEASLTPCQVGRVTVVDTSSEMLASLPPSQTYLRADVTGNAQIKGFQVTANERLWATLETVCVYTQKAVFCDVFCNFYTVDSPAI